MASGVRLEVRTVAGIVIHQLDAEYDRLLRGKRSAIEANWIWRMGLVGQEVAVELMDGSTISGRLLELNFDRLELHKGNGVVHAIVPEAVRHVVGK
jgi:hypothetical protein